MPIDAKLLFSVGELNKNKNHEAVIRALAELRDENVHYAIAGAGELQSYLGKLSEALGIGGRVHLLGYREDVGDLYKIADIFVLPSLREGLNVSLMEAMASGLPVICARIRGNVDLIEDISGGILCAKNRTDEYEETISRVLINKTLRRMMVERNLYKIQDFDTAKIMEMNRLIYRNI